MLSIITYPQIDPVLVQFGPLVIRWYALAYIAGIIGGWYYIKRLCQHKPYPLNEAQIDDIMVWITAGVVLGGRLGYVFFYKPGYFLHHPLEIFQIWQGGMSFHGGALGVIIAMWLFARKNKIAFLPITDAVVCAVPIGLFFGRIANFINGELFGRPTDVPWAMIFPYGGNIPRHPSQLYEAFEEGLILFIILLIAWRKESFRLKPGALSGLFLLGYWAARSSMEFFREPDSFLGFFPGGFTMGQLLSAPMFVVGLWLIFRPQKA